MASPTYGDFTNAANIVRGRAKDASTLESHYAFADAAFTGVTTPNATTLRGLICQNGASGMTLGINTDAVIPYICMLSATDIDIARQQGGSPATDLGAYVNASPAGTGLYGVNVCLPMVAPFEVWSTTYDTGGTFVSNTALGSAKTGVTQGLVTARTTGQTLIGLATAAPGAQKGGYPGVTVLPFITCVNHVGLT